jgi:hypothetical protein
MLPAAPPSTTFSRPTVHSPDKPRHSGAGARGARRRVLSLTAAPSGDTKRSPRP